MITDLDRTLVARAKDGDLDAFERLYRTHVGRVHAVCLRLTGDPGEAEERTQDTFVKAWERLGSFEGRSAFGSWLYRLAVNLVIDARRARATRRRFEIADDEPEAAARLPEAGLGLDLERAIAGLPEGARMVYVMHEVLGYRHEEIGELLGVAVGTSKAQLHRAREILRRILSS
jgi:RNA polymerase sigma-70 factor (ECF subfamily)